MWGRAFGTVALFFFSFAIQLHQWCLATDRSGSRPAMDSFAKALIDRDKTSFLVHFSKKRAFKVYWLMINEPLDLDGGQQMNYAFLKQQCEEGDDSFCGLFIAEDGLFRQTMMATGSRPWREVHSDYFVPDGQPSDAHIFVRWRQEAGKFVIDAIGVQLN